MNKAGKEGEKGKKSNNVPANVAEDMKISL